MHGTRAEKTEENLPSGTVNGGCAFADNLSRCLGWFICAFAIQAILHHFK